MLKPFPFLGIRSRLILLLLIILVPLLLIETFISHRTYKARESEELRANVELARAVARSFDTFISNILHSQWVIGRVLTMDTPISARDRDRILDDFAADNPVIRSVFWVDPGGQIVASSLRTYIGFDVSDRSFVKDVIAGRDWAVSELIVGRATGKPAFTISRGIRNAQGMLLGIVAASIEPERLDNVLKVERSKEAGISIIDHKGMHVFRYPLAAYTMEQRNWLKLYPILGDALKGKEVAIRQKSKIRGEERLVAFVPVSSLGWVAAASRSEDEAMKPIIATLGFQAGLVLLVVLLSFGAAMVLSRPTLNAIIRLRNHALALGQGEMKDFVVTSGPNEIKDLSLALNKMATEVQLREKRLEDANKELESFSYTVSHDLKAPLRAIDGYSRMMLKKCGSSLDEEATRLFNVIRINTAMMNVLIDDLLSFSRVLRESMNLVQIDMKHLVSEVWEDIRAANQERELELKAANIMPAYGDLTLIRQVLFNLISNAVKFTKNQKPGIIELTSYMEADKVVYCVKDNGIGFDMAYYDKLFAIFQRLHGVEAYEGTGVGLAIVQRIVQRHGGRIWAEGKVDEGATFCFTLPPGKE
jgi:signal transduction histidine kinase